MQSQQKEKISHEDIQQWLVNYLTKELGVEDIGTKLDADFDELGIDSADAMRMVGDLEDYLGYELSASVPYQHPSITSLAKHLGS